MEGRKLKLIFEYKEDLLKFGQEKLYNEMVKIIKDVDKKYILKPHGVAEQLYSLFGFKNNTELKETLNQIPVCELVPYIKILAENIFKAIEDERSFISRCLKETYEKYYCNLEIEFNLRKIEFENDDNEFGYCYDLGLEIMSISKSNRCGGGHTFCFNVINSNNLKIIKDQVNILDMPQSVKEKYINYFDDETEDNFCITTSKKWITDEIISFVDNFIYENQNKYKQYDSLYKQGVKDELIDAFEEDDFMNEILDSIVIDYGLKKATSYAVIMERVKCKEGEYYTNENSIDIKFLGEVIKTIEKSSYTVYEIN